MVTKRILATLAGALLAGTALAAADMSDVQITTTEVGPGIYMLAGRGGNIGVSVGDDGIVMIDDQYEELTPKIRAALALLSPRQVRFVINTHWHGDHTGGNANLADTGAIIVASDQVRQRLEAGGFMEAFKRQVDPAPRSALPIVTFEGRVSFHLNGHEIDAFNVPAAHTDGDSIVFFKDANVLHMGDTYFNGLYPIVDWGSGGDPIGLITAVDRVLPLIDDATKVIPGHGPLSDKAGLVSYRAMLATLLPRFEKAIRQGKSKEQVVALKLTQDFDAVWGQGFMKPDDWSGMIYEGLKRSRGRTWK